jgi:hypothetical protein
MSRIRFQQSELSGPLRPLLLDLPHLFQQHTSLVFNADGLTVSEGPHLPHEEAGRRVGLGTGAHC